MSPGANAFSRVDNIQKKSSKEKQFVGNDFRREGLSAKSFKSASGTLQLVPVGDNDLCWSKSSNSSLRLT